MSLANILEPNNYDIYASGISTNKIVLVNPVNDSLEVELSCYFPSLPPNNTLIVGATGTNEILCGGVQFSANEDILNHYLIDTSDTTFNLSAGPDTGVVICKFSRVGSIIFVQIRGQITETPNILVSSIAVPFLPSSNAYFTIPVGNDAAASKKAGNKICWIDTNGIINVGNALNDSAALDNGATYYIGSFTGTGDDRYYFSYIL